MPLSRRQLLVLLPATVLAVVTFSPGPADAGELEDAKAQGWIGERRDGYLGVVQGAPAGAQALVDRVNTDRRAAYDSVAQSNNVPRNQVEALAGQKLIARAKAGEFIMDAAGRWIRK